MRSRKDVFSGSLDALAAERENLYRSRHWSEMTARRAIYFPWPDGRPRPQMEAKHGRGQEHRRRKRGE